MQTLDAHPAEKKQAAGIITLPAPSIARGGAGVLQARHAQMDARSPKASQKSARGWDRRAAACATSARLF
jgi:hypothetical protein